MDVLALLKEALDLVPNLQDLQLKLADAEAALAEMAKVNFDKGFAEGVASVPVNGELKYTQADLDMAVAMAVEPLNLKIADLEAQMAGVDGKIAEALAVFKADLLAKYVELQVQESVIETGFQDLLK